MHKIFYTNLKIQKKIFFFFILVSISFLFNYLNYVILSKILSPKDFGIFYTAIVLSNILITPCIVYNFYFSKVIIDSSISKKLEKIQEKFSNLFFLSLIYFFILQIFFFFFHFYYEINYTLYLILSIITCLQFYIEYLRLILDIEKNLIKSSSYTFFFNLLKLIFCSVIVLFYLKVWIVLMGFMIAQCLVIFHYYYNNNLKVNFEYINFNQDFNLNFIKFSLIFILMILFSYIDIILSYFLLTNSNNFSSYSSSTVLPKSILMFSLPFIKAIYPNLHYQKENFKKILFNFILILIASFMILSIVYFSNFFFPSILKIQNINQEILLYSSWATFFAIANVLLILYNLANRNYNNIFIGFILSILLIVYFFQNFDFDSISFAFSTVKLYGISFCIFLTINIINIKNYDA